MINQLTKEKHYIPCTTDDSGIITKATTCLLLNNIKKFYGLPLSVTSDQGRQFILGVWKNLCKILGIKANLSILFHPKTDEQSEIANQEIKSYLYTFVNYQQDDWSEKFAIAKFAANNNVLASTKLFPFFVTKSLYPNMSFDIIELSNTNICEQIFQQKTLDISGNMQTT